jgi:two-component system, response regulator
MSASRPLRPDFVQQGPGRERNSTRPSLVTRILIIEDNPLDVKLLQHIFAYEPEWRTEFVVVEDGEEAIEYLLHPETAKPDLVILDLKLPKRDGLDVLIAIRKSEHLHGVRVVIFSSYPEAIIRSKMALANLHADDYINKPDGFSEFSSLAKRFRQCCDSSMALSEYPASAQAIA